METLGTALSAPADRPATPGGILDGNAWNETHAGHGSGTKTPAPQTEPGVLIKSLDQGQLDMPASLAVSKLNIESDPASLVSDKGVLHPAPSLSRMRRRDSSGRAPSHRRPAGSGTLRVLPTARS